MKDKDAAGDTAAPEPAASALSGQPSEPVALDEDVCSSRVRGRPMVLNQWRYFREAGSSPDDILEAFDVMMPPVPIVEIMRGMGVRLRLQAGPEIGRLTTAALQPEATIDPRLSTERRRLVLAHQLGHLLLHPIGPVYVERRNLRGPPRNQTEATTFARDLLMPAWLLGPTAQTLGYDVDAIAHVFAVSPRVLEVQLFGSL